MLTPTHLPQEPPDRCMQNIFDNIVLGLHKLQLHVCYASHRQALARIKAGLHVLQKGRGCWESHHWRVDFHIGLVRLLQEHSLLAPGAACNNAKP